MDGKGEGKGFSWSCQMGLHVCLELMHVLLKHIPLHEQGFMRNVIMLMEVGYDLKLTPNIYEKLKQVF